MTEKNNNSTDKGMRKLINDLDKLEQSNDNRAFNEDSDDLSLMLDEALRGVDIRKVYPEFYMSLRINKELQQRFISGINILRPGNEIKKVQVNLIPTFFDEFSQTGQKSRVNIQQNIQQLQSVFFPKQDLVYRGASDQEHHYLLLNEEIELQPVTYSLLVEGTLSDEPNKLTIEADLAISNTGEPDFAALPVDLEITWGEYRQHLTLSDEGVTTLMDVPFTAFLNTDLTQVTAAMDLTLTRPQ